MNWMLLGPLNRDGGGGGGMSAGGLRSRSLW